MNHLVVTVILSRLDYCNSLLAGLRGQPSPLHSESRIPLHDSFWACHHVIMSVRHWLTYTGCRFAIGFSTK